MGALWAVGLEDGIASAETGLYILPRLVER